MQRKLNSFLSNSLSKVLIIVLLGAGSFALIQSSTSFEILGLSFFLFILTTLLAGYWYPRYGIISSLVLALHFSSSVVVRGTLSPLSTLFFFFIFVIIGLSVSHLSGRITLFEKNLTDLLDLLPVATYAIDKRGRVIAWNKAIEDLTGIKRADILSKGKYEYAIPFYKGPRPMLADLVLRGDLTQDTLFTGLIHKEGQSQCSLTIPDFKDGKFLSLRHTATAIRDTEGQIIGAIESIEDLSEQEQCDTSLKNTIRRLSLIAGIVRNDIKEAQLTLESQLRAAVNRSDDPEMRSSLSEIRSVSEKIGSQVALSQAFQEIGTAPTEWIPVQTAIETAISRLDAPHLSFTVWTERLEIYSDPHLPAVFTPLFSRLKRRLTEPVTVIITYEIRERGCAILIEVDCKHETKERTLSPQFHPGMDLLLALEILSLSGSTLRELKGEEEGSGFEIEIPTMRYRII